MSNLQVQSIIQGSELQVSVGLAVLTDPLTGNHLPFFPALTQFSGFSVKTANPLRMVPLVPRLKSVYYGA